MSKDDVREQFGRLLKLMVFVEAVGVEGARQLVIKAKRTFAESGVNGLNELQKELATPETMNKMLLVSILQEIALAASKD